MRIEIQLRIVGDDRVISLDEVLHLDKSDDRLEAIGLSLSEAKAVMACIQERVVTVQAASFLVRHRCCRGCGEMDPGYETEAVRRRDVPSGAGLDATLR